MWMNVDYVAQRYFCPPQARPRFRLRFSHHACNRYPNARVTAATVAGFYFYATYYSGPNHTEAGSMADFR